jgi:hypothetical protein
VKTIINEMQQKPILETRGVIVKEEWVKSLTSNTLPETLVLESTEALPGYFGKNAPDMEKPRSIFLVLDKKYDGYFVARKLQLISDIKQHTCYATFGYLVINNKMYHCIRIKNLDCFASIPEIQNELINQGIKMMRYKDINEYAMIHIHKSFLISLVADHIYMDLFEHDRYYLRISRNMVWTDFKKITDIVKSNLENSMFDAAIGSIWTINKLIDVIRIYDKKHDIKSLTQIRERYESEIKRWNENKLFKEEMNYNYKEAI